MKTLLPLGSVIKLKGGEINLIVYGRKQLLVSNDERNGDMYDYLAVPYPEGYISPEYTYVFNHENIEKVIFEGMSDEEEKEFQKVLEKASAE